MFLGIYALDNATAVQYSNVKNPVKTDETTETLLLREDARHRKGLA
jgi:hypothetical protein